MVLAAIHSELPPARYSLDRGGVWPRTSSDYSHACTRNAMLIDARLCPALVDSKPFGRHFGSRDPVRYLLKGDVASMVGRPVIGLGIDAEWREATVVGRA
jgi:hypothetical protein